MSFILKKAEVSIIVCSSDILRKELVKLLTDCPNLHTIIVMDYALMYTEVCFRVKGLDDVTGMIFDYMWCRTWKHVKWAFQIAFA